MIESLLKNYKRNVALLELNKIKINQLENDLSKDIHELDKLYSKREYIEPGMPKSQRISNPTEDMVIRVEKIKNNIKNQIRTTITRNEKTSDDIEKVKWLLSSLTEEERFLIERKYFEKEKSYAITRKFNTKFRMESNDYITQSGIRKRTMEIVRSLQGLLGN